VRDLAIKNPLRKLRDKMRFDWHEKLIMTELEISGSVSRYASWIMHDKQFKLSEYGYVELSTRAAARKLRMDRRTVQAANDWLVSRRWLMPIPRHGQETQRYRLGDGLSFWLLLQRQHYSARACACCGQHFEPLRTNAMFCSAACRQKAYRQSRTRPRVTAGLS
jgi:hypothetical protein